MPSCTITDPGPGTQVPPAQQYKVNCNIARASYELRCKLSFPPEAGLVDPDFPITMIPINGAASATPSVAAVTVRLAAVCDA